MTRRKKKGNLGATLFISFTSVLPHEEAFHQLA
jgi:hypothetical protein